MTRHMRLIQKNLNLIAHLAALMDSQKTLIYRRYDSIVGEVRTHQREVFHAKALQQLKLL